MSKNYAFKKIPFLYKNQRSNHFTIKRLKARKTGCNIPKYLDAPRKIASEVNLKSRIEVENFSGKTSIAVNQDFYAKIFMMSLCANLASPIEEKAK
jgi:hypothetical protein